MSPPKSNTKVPDVLSAAPDGKSITRPYVRTPREQETLRGLIEDQDKKGAPRIKVETADDTSQLSVDHPDLLTGQALLMEALGTKDISFYDVLISQLADVGRQGRSADERGLNFMLSVIKGVQPRDEVETMLATQMAAIHNATMTFARRLNHVETIPQQDSASNALNKLARSFAMQVEALKRYRTGGEQKVTVQHVNVNEGGQAIVGTINTGGGVHKKADTTS